jgi:hypothetical protein
MEDRHNLPRWTADGKSGDLKRSYKNPNQDNVVISLRSNRLERCSRHEQIHAGIQNNLQRIDEASDGRTT